MSPSKTPTPPLGVPLTPSGSAEHVALADLSMNPEVMAYRLREVEKSLKLGAARFGELDHKIDERTKAPTPLSFWQKLGAVTGLLIFLLLSAYAAAQFPRREAFEEINKSVIDLRLQLADRLGKIDGRLDRLEDRRSAP